MYLALFNEKMASHNDLALRDYLHCCSYERHQFVEQRGRGTVQPQSSQPRQISVRPVLRFPTPDHILRSVHFVLHNLFEESLVACVKLTRSIEVGKTSNCKITISLHQV